MNLLFVTNARIPTEKANGVQIVKMCEAFRNLGINVELFIPTRRQPQDMQAIQDLWKYYEVETPFPLKYIHTPDFLIFENILPSAVMQCLYYIQCFLFSLVVLLKNLSQSAQGQRIYYSRSLQTIFLLCLTKPLHRKRIYFEAHELHGDPKKQGRGRKFLSTIMRWMLRHLDGIIVITHRLKELYTEMGVEKSHILVAPDGVDLKRFSSARDKFAARKKLHIPVDKKVICYTGHLFKWKGVYTLAESSQYLPEDFLIYIVGGTETDRRALQQFLIEKELKHVVITGYVPYAEVPFYWSAADVVVLPNSAKMKISREYTSPLKLFEYMGAQRPIVASDLPSIREILKHRENAYLVQADAPRKLADGIMHVISDRALSEHITKAAYVQVQEYTWSKRAAAIADFFKRTATNEM